MAMLPNYECDKPGCENTFLIGGSDHYIVRTPNCEEYRLCMKHGEKATGVPFDQESPNESKGQRQPF